LCIISNLYKTDLAMPLMKKCQVDLTLLRRRALLSFFLFVSNSLYHSTLIRPLSTVILSSLLRTTFQILSWTLHLYIKFTDFQWNWFCTHLLSLLLELDAKLPWLSSSLRCCFPSIHLPCPADTPAISPILSKHARRSHLARIVKYPHWSHRGAKERSI